MTEIWQKKGLTFSVILEPGEEKKLRMDSIVRFPVTLTKMEAFALCHAILDEMRKSPR